MILRADLHARRQGSRPRFAPGQLVRHARYGYRGVVVELDLSCEASENWYRSNRSQPDRDQPWYHVLVHGAPTTTYAAESSLVEDDSVEPIQHPLLDIYFGRQDEDGHYVRNEQPWASAW